MTNSDALTHLDDKLSHLSVDEREQVVHLIHQFPNLFSDIPGLTSAAVHDIDVNGAQPIKQLPYRINRVKLEAVKQEIEYMLAHKMIEPSQSDWSSPILLVPKADQTWRFCVDFRRVNSVTKTDSYPLPRVDDCIDQIGSAKYVSKFDLLKGYWQVPLTDQAKEITAFVTPDGLYQFRVMPFGLKNAPSTFQRLMNRVISSVNRCVVYIDDVVVYSDSFSQHLDDIRTLFEQLSQANLTVNLRKSDIGHGEVTYLGYVVGSGHVKPLGAKVEAILDFPKPGCKRDIQRFLGMAGYYRRFINKFADIVSPLTNLLKKSAKFEWDESCQSGFDLLKTFLCSYPILVAPDVNLPFSMHVDASDVAIGSVLLQKDYLGIDHPVAYFSKKLSPYQKKYATIEKEALALLLSLEHFEVYVNSSPHCLCVFTDHNPLTFVKKFKNHNRRLMGWYLCLQEYDLEISHIPGKDNLVADALSRR